MKTPYEIARDIATRAQEKRLTLNLSQKTLAQRSGVSYGTLKKFERTGQISLESLLKLALVLSALDDFEQLFSNKNSIPLSLDTLLKDNTKTRKRGRQ